MNIFFQVGLSPKVDKSIKDRSQVSKEINQRRIKYLINFFLILSIVGLVRNMIKLDNFLPTIVNLNTSLYMCLFGIMAVMVMLLFGFKLSKFDILLYIILVALTIFAADLLVDKWRLVVSNGIDKFIFSIDDLLLE